MSGAREIIIVGGGPAGVAAAMAAKQQDAAADVVLLNDEHHEPYEKPPLSKAVLTGKLLLLGGRCRCDARRSASDNDDPARAAHARRADSISSMYSSPLAMTSIEA